MSFAKLKRFEEDRAAAKIAAARAETIARKSRAERELKKAVMGVLPKSLTAPTRPRGRTPPGGIGRGELLKLREKAASYLRPGASMTELEAEVQHTALVILLIDGLLGTEPWRNQGGMGGMVAANARVRYMENAARLLDDLRQHRAGVEPALLAGVIDVPTEGPQ